MTESCAETAPLVLITGASQGIGAAIAELFAAKISGVRLALVARSENNLNAVKARCCAAASTSVFPCDVSDAAQVAELGNCVREALGVPDVLVNNAGVWHGEPVHAMSPDDFNRVVASNLGSTFLLCREFLGDMMARNSGDIFNMSSTAGFEGYAGVSAYCAAKHGVAGFTKALREEVREYNIRVCSVSPGPTWSPSWFASGVPEQSLMPAEDVARAFLNVYQMHRNVVTEDIVLRPRQGHIVSGE